MQVVSFLADFYLEPWLELLKSVRIESKLYSFSFQFLSTMFVLLLFKEVTEADSVGQAELRRDSVTRDEVRRGLEDFVSLAKNLLKKNLSA